MRGCTQLEESLKEPPLSGQSSMCGCLSRRIPWVSERRSDRSRERSVLMGILRVCVREFGLSLVRVVPVTEILEIALPKSWEWQNLWELRYALSRLQRDLRTQSIVCELSDRLRATVREELVRAENAFLCYIGIKELLTDVHGFLRCKSIRMWNTREASNTFTEDLKIVRREIKWAYSLF